MMASMRRILGELLVTAGVVVLLFVIWQVWWTSVIADRDASKVVAELQQILAQPVATAPTGTPTASATPQPGGSATGSPTETPKTPKATPPSLGSAFALLRVPRFENGVLPVYEGTGNDVLQRGVGHYVDSALPGEIGNFAVAGHRRTYGDPFDYINLLVPGDAVIVETAQGYLVYRITGSEIVPPSQSSVLLPVPNQPGEAPTEAVMTLTSCHPRYGSGERYIAYADLDATYTRAEGLPASLLTVGG